MSLARALGTKAVLRKLLSSSLTPLSTQSTRVRYFNYGGLHNQTPKHHLAPSSFLQSKQYSIFSKSDSKSPSNSKVQVLDTTIDTKSVLDKLSHEQQDTILELNKYLRRDKRIDFNEIKPLIFSLVNNTRSREADLPLIRYLLTTLNQLKSRTQDLSGSKQVLRDEPIRLDEIFNQSEIYSLLIWFCRKIRANEKTLLIYKDKLLRFVLPELFFSIKDNKNIPAESLAEAHIYFNQFLLSEKFYRQAAENLEKLVEMRSSDHVKLIALEKVIEDLKYFNVRDSVTIFRMFSLLYSGLGVSDNSQSDLILSWFEYFTESYDIEVREKASDLKFMEQLKQLDVMTQFIECLLNQNNPKLSMELLVIISQYHNLKPQIRYVLESLANFLKSVLSGENPDFTIDQKAFATIIAASIINKDDFLINEQLVSFFRNQFPENKDISKEAWDQIFAWKVYNSFGNDFASANGSMLKEIKQVSQYKIDTPGTQNQQVTEVNGEIYIDLPLDLKEEDKSYINADTVNQLLSAAGYSRKSTKYIKSMTDYFESEYDIQLNAESYSVLIDAAIENTDAINAKKFFQMSLDSGISWNNELNEANNNVLFRLIQYLFNMSESYEDLKESFSFFTKLKSFIDEVDSDTVHAILVKFLQFDYVGDALELLDKEFISTEDNTTSKYFGKMNEEDTFNLENESLNARKIDLKNDYSHKIYNTLNDFLLNNKISDVCWLIYGTIHRCFINVPYDSYLPVMRKFNELKRPDASLLVFQQMKKLNRLFGLLPPNETHYIYLLESFGEMSYETGIIELHAMLRLDLTVDSSIRMKNALLSAYTNLQDFIKTRDLFEQLLAVPKTNKKNALNSDTINIMLKSYTYGGIKHVQSFWDNLSDIDYIPDESNYKQFIISNCYHEKYDDALDLIEEMKFNGLEVKLDVIKELYNWTENKDAKHRVKLWLLSSGYSEQWDQLEKGGLLAHGVEESEPSPQ